MPIRSRTTGTRARVVVALAVAGLLVAAGCGDDDGDDTTTTTAPDETTTTAGDGDGDGDGDGAITIDDLETRCDELTDIATELRGEAPESSEASGEPPGPVDVLVDDEPGYETAACIYAYEGDTFQDQNRIWLQIDRILVDSPAVEDTVWELLAFDTEIPDLGDEAIFYTSTAFGAESVVHVRVGDSVARVRVDVPAELEGAPYLDQEPMVAATNQFLDRVEL